MNEVGREIAILSLGQVLAVADEHVEDPRALETIERHVRQVAAIIQGKPHNKPDEETAALIQRVRALIAETEPQLAPAA
jgi:thiamine monophosphate synthase